MQKTALLIALTTGLLMFVAGVTPWLAAGVVLVWLGTLWLLKPMPDVETDRVRKSTLSTDAAAAFLEPLHVPLLLLAGDRIVAGNTAARAALGGHIVNQDVRVALRHPEAIALVSGSGPATVTVPGLTTAKSLWHLSRYQIDPRHILIELVDGTAEADISRAHTDFVANASHELRTPLASILGYLETLTDQGDTIPKDTQARFLVTMESEARRMKALVEDLMSLSRVEAEKHDLPSEVIDIAAVARAIAKDVGTVKGTDRISFTGPDDPLTIIGERSQIDQLIRNLVDNALKYGHDDAPVGLAVAAEGAKVRLTVQDQGPGIAPEHLPLLTRRFYRTDPGRSRASGGTGLGLAIVKHIVERHRGMLDITSTLGEGTRVSATFPMSQGPS